MSEKFSTLYRKIGFFETLDILSSLQNCEAKQIEFFKHLKERGSYLNSFFRIKRDLLRLKLIAYKLDSVNDLVIHLTEKGRKLTDKITEIEQLIGN